MTTSIAQNATELGEICELPTEVALPRAARFVADLAGDPAFLEAEVLPLLREAEGARDWYVARRYGGDRYALEVFVWPAGTGTKIHDHSSWGAYHCVAGSVLEQRYGRLDDGSVPDHARIREAWRLSWGPEDGASTVLPGDGGIHRISNPWEEVAVSVHLYGPRIGEADGRDYDPSRDHVCDRPDD